MPDPAGRRALRWRHLPAALGYALLTAVVMWPAVVHFRTRAMADGVDAAMFSWLWWAMPRALGEGANPYTSDLVFHPVGADLALTTSAPLVSALTWPVQALLGTEAQVNVVQLASMFLAGFATYLLAEHLCRHRGASFVAGLAYAVLPGRFVHVDSHLNLVETAVLPLGLLAFVRFVEAPTTRRATVVGVALGASFLVEPQLAVLSGLGMVVLGIGQRRALATEVRRLTGAALVAVVVAAPLLVPMVVDLTSGGRAEPDPTSASILYSSSPLSWVVPPLDRLWMGHLASVEPLTPTIEGVAYPGLAMLLLAFVGASVVDRPRRRGWVLMAVVGFVLSLGPYPFIRDDYVEVPLPFFLVRLLPGLDALRVPGRFALLGALALHVLAALTLAALARRRPHRATLLLVAVAAITLVELWPRSLPTRPASVAEPYEEIAADPDPGAVLEVPLKWSTTQGYYGFDGHDRDFTFLLDAMVHERPVVSGAVSRYDQEKLDELLAIPTYRQLLALGGEEGFDDRPTFDRGDLRELGIGFVVYHRDDPVPDALTYLRGLDLPVLADDGTVIVWKVEE